MWGCISLSILSFASRWIFPEWYINRFANSTVLNIDKYEFEVALDTNHSLLAEYRQIVKVKQGDATLLEREFFDTGGRASIYFTRRGDRMTVNKGDRNGFVMDLPSGEILEMTDPLSKEQEFGRFMFVYQPDQSFRWVAAEDIPTEQK